MGKSYYASEPPFNMALATLMRLDAILQQIKNLSYLYPRDSPEKQKAYLELAQQFYLNAVPLFSPEDSTKYKAIFKIKLKRNPSIKTGSQSYNVHYDSDINDKINDCLIEMQQRLRKYFMPSSRHTEGL